VTQLRLPPNSGLSAAVNNAAYFFHQDPSTMDLSPTVDTYDAKTGTRGRVRIRVPDRPD
jgi:hypothetical protein